MKSNLNSYFDKIYVINLKSREDRMNSMKRKLDFFNIDYERVDAIPGDALSGVYADSLKNTYYKNPNYLGANLTHLSVYSQACKLGYNCILILEDDLRIHRNIDILFNKVTEQNKNIKNKDYSLLYLAYIPLSDDLSRWDYNILSEKVISSNVIKAKSLWSLMAYGITSSFMKYVLSFYSNSFKKELDRFFVENIQRSSEFKCFASSPQLFASDNGLSDNDNIDHQDLLIKSVDTRFAKLHDYV